MIFGTKKQRKEQTIVKMGNNDITRIKNTKLLRT